MAAKQSRREGWSLIVVRHPSLENGWDIPHSQILVWHLGMACNEVWWGGCPDGEMTWGGTRQTHRRMEDWRDSARINKGHASIHFHCVEFKSDTHYIAVTCLTSAQTSYKEAVCLLWYWLLKPWLVYSINSTLQHSPLSHNLYVQFIQWGQCGQ